jgi:hypothetical protein
MARWPPLAQCKLDPKAEGPMCSDVLTRTLENVCERAHEKILVFLGFSRASRTVPDIRGNMGGGWGEIRTHGDVSATPVFKTGALNRSATHPYVRSIT